MSVRSWLASRFRPRAAGEVAAPPPYWHLRYPLYREAGVPITPDLALQVSAVYACCRLIVDSLAPAPIQVVEVKPKGEREVLHDDDVAYTLDWGAPVSKASDAPTGQAVEEALLWSALIWGNGYAEIQRDAAQKFFALWPIEPERVVPRRDENGVMYYAVSQPGAYGGIGGGTVRVEATSMFHLRGPSLHGWVGDSPIYRAAKAIGIAQAAQTFTSAYFANGTVIGGILRSELAVTETQANEALDKWNRAHGNGPMGSHGIAVLGKGLTYQPIGNNASEAQLLEARKFQVHEIARFFGIPSTLLSENEAWTNVTELYLGAYRNALLPWAARFDAEATRKLFPLRKPWREVRHDLSHVIMGSFKDQVESFRNAVNSGIYTRNEAREQFGLNSAGPDGDSLTVEGRMQSLENVLRPAEPAGEQPLGGGAQPPKPGAKPDEPPANKPVPVKTGPAPASVARVAIALDRFERKVAARRADLERNQTEAEKAAANLADLRARIEPDLCAAIREALGVGPEMDMRVTEAATEVLAGKPAHVAAEELAA